MGKSEILSADENKKLNEEMLRMREKKNMPARQDGIKEEEKEENNLQPEAETKQSAKENVIQEKADNSNDKNVMVKNKPLDKGIKLICQYNEGEKEKDIYEVLQELSVGSFGRTYLCKRIGGVDDGIPVVIKEFCPDPKDTYRKANHELDINYIGKERIFEDFLKEPRRVKDLKDEARKRNPQFPKREWEKLNLAIPLTDEPFTCFNNWYYVMEYVEGKTLTEYLIENYDNLSLEKRLRIVLQICIAIHNLHSKDCVHQDLSPNNVMIQEDENGILKVKVIDYGMSTTLFHTNAYSSIVRNGGSRGLSDALLQYGNYKTLCGGTEEDKELIKLIDIYSLGNILIYTCLAGYELITSEWEDYFLKPVLNEEPIVADTPIGKKEEAIKRMIRELAKDATNLDLNERAQSLKSGDDNSRPNEKTKFIDYFINRLKNIQAELMNPIMPDPAVSPAIVEDGENNPEGQVPAEDNEVIKEEPEPQNSKETNPEEGSVDTTAEIIKKAENGDAIAQSNLGLWYELGLEMPQDMQKAKEWYAKAAAQGDTTAQYKLGYFYEEGKGVPKNLNEAIKWYTQAAQQGHAVSKIALKRLSRKRIFYQRLAFLCILGGIALIAAIIFGIYKVYPEVFPFSSNQPKQEQASMDNRVTPETDLVETKTEEPIENKEQQAQTVKQQIQTEERKLPLNERPTRTTDKIQEGHNTSTIDVSALTPATLTALMGKAQTDAVTRERLFNVFADGIIFLVMDENGNAFDLPRLKLFNNLEENAYQIGKTHRVDNFENENGKIRIIYLTEIK